MAIDARIPMMGQPIDTATPIDSAQKAEMNGLAIIKQHYDNATEEQKKQVRDVAVVSQQLLGMQDPKMQAAFIERNRGAIGEHTDEMLQALQADPVQAKQMFGSQIKLAELLGAMKDPKTDSNTFGSEAVKGIMDTTGQDYASSLYQYQTGNRKDQTLQNGVVAPMKGSLDTKTASKRADAIGSTVGEGVGKAKLALGSVENNADYVLQNVEDLMTHPGKDKALGLINSNTPTIKGTEADAFENRLAQVNGASFLTAFDALRGAGAITEAEGSKATIAKNRMLTAHTVKEFDAAAGEFTTQVRKGLRLAKQQAAGQLADPNAQSTDKSGGILHVDAKGNKAIVFPDGTYQEVP